MGSFADLGPPARKRVKEKDNIKREIRKRANHFVGKIRTTSLSRKVKWKLKPGENADLGGSA